MEINGDQGRHVYLDRKTNGDQWRSREIKGDQGRHVYLDRKTLLDRKLIDAAFHHQGRVVDPRHLMRGAMSDQRVIRGSSEVLRAH